MLCKDTVGWHRGVGSQWRVYIHMCMGGCDDAQAWPRGATTRPRSGAKAGRTPYRRGCGQEELPHVQGQGQWPRVPGCDGVARPRPGMAAERSNTTSKEWWLRGCRRAYRSYSTIKVRRGSGEEIPLVQCELCWSSCEEISHVQGRRNPSKTVVLREDIGGQTH